MHKQMFKGKVIMVVGGGSGVGRAVAEEIHKRGGHVVIADREVQVVNDLLSQHDEKMPQRLHVELDLLNIAQCEKAFDLVASKFGRLDGLFCYAGVTAPSELLECNEAHFDEIMGINFKGVLFCCKYGVKLMKENGGGAIVLTGSPHSEGGDKDRLVYACSKGAQFPLMKHLAQHYAKCGIRANMLTLGWTPTEGEIALRETQGMSEDELREWASSIIPANRMTEVDDVVEGVVYLLSSNALMVSGSELRVTGGWYL